MVNANKFRVPGWGVLEKGTEAIMDWCRNRLPEEALQQQEQQGRGIEDVDETF